MKVGFIKSKQNEQTDEMSTKKEAFRLAFQRSLPVMTGYGLLGTAYGVYMHNLGFGFFYPMMMAMLIYAGSVEFLVGNLLLGSFNPMQTFFLTLIVNARHLFYGLSLLDQYKGFGWKKFFLIFGLTDETFAVVKSTSDLPENIDKGWFYLFLTWLDESYWVIGATFGGLLAPLLTFDMRGIDFVLTAMFVAIFTDNWLRESDHRSSFIGLIICILGVLLFGTENFIIPSLCAILLILTLLRKSIEPNV